MTKINPYLHFAMGCYLSEWPHDLSEEDALDILSEITPNRNKNGDQILLTWEPFENHPESFVFEQIDSLWESLTQNFIVRKY